MTLTPLFGGAIETELPEQIIDVSNFRQVPDNQEVFLIEHEDKSRDKSIIIEILEQPEGDIEEVIKLHLSDVIEQDDIKRQNFSFERVANNISQENYLIQYCDKSKENQEIFVLSLIRLIKANTDILVTIKTNPLDFQYEKLTGETILKTLTVKNWQLFL